MKILGILLLLAGLFLGAIGLIGAVVCFVLPSNSPTCELADSAYKRADDAAKKYEAAKGTPEEDTAKRILMMELDDAKGATEACAEMKATYRMYAIGFAVPAVLGFFLIVGGIGGIFLGRRKKKAA